MKDSLIIGLTLGFLAGAVLVTKNEKAREMVEDGAKAMEEKIDQGKKAVKKQMEKMK